MNPEEFMEWAAFATWAEEHQRMIANQMNSLGSEGNVLDSPNARRHRNKRHTAKRANYDDGKEDDVISLSQARERRIKNYPKRKNVKEDEQLHLRRVA